MSKESDSNSAYEFLDELSIKESDSINLTQDIQKALNAFSPQAKWQERALIIVQLAKSIESLENSKDWKENLIIALQKNFCDFKEAPFRTFAATRFITTLFTFTPNYAHEVLFKSDLLKYLMATVVDKKDRTSFSLNTLAVAELLCLSASNNESRKALLSQTSNESDQKEEEAKLREITDEEEAMINSVQPVQWLVSLVERTELENPKPTMILSKVSLLASLTLHKLTRVSSKEGGITPGQQEGLQGLPKDPEAEEAEQKKQAEEDAFLNEMCRRHVLLGREAEIKSISDASEGEINSSLVNELARMCQLSAVEGLSYLSLQPVYRHSIANDTDLLRTLCALGKIVTGQEGVKARNVFPVRGKESNKTTIESSYELDKLFDSKTSSQFNHNRDTAIQFGITSLLANIMAYPAVKSKEEEQMEKLRRLANARNAEGTDENDPFLSVDAIEERIRRVISVKGIEALVSIALSKAPSTMMGKEESANTVIVNQSASVRQSVSSALLHATTRQDKRQRGLIIQQGGAKALISIANVTISNLIRRIESNNDAVEANSSISFTAIQALAHLLITENPAMVSTNPVEMIPSLALLYLHHDSSRLQKFEASLALTNVASLSPQLANRVANAGFQRSLLETNAADAFIGAGRGQDSIEKVNVSSILRDRIFLEENDLSRRASLELLCNLLVVDEVYQRWSGELEDDEQAGKYLKNASDDDDNSEANKLHQTKSARDLSFLIALCAPSGVNETSKESGLKLRLAAGGAVATLCSSASTCARILALEPRILNKICKMLDAKIGLQQLDRIVEIKEQNEDDDPEEDQNLNREDIESDPLGDVHGQCQLAIRGLTCIECIIQYIDWIRGQGTNDTTAYKRAIIQSGVIEAVKSIIKTGTNQLKAKTQHPPAAIQELQMQITKQSLTILKTVQQLGMLDN